MRRARASLLLSMGLLFPLAASTPLACCAGAIDRHSIRTAGETSHCGGGGGCCERASVDGSARHCCQGGDTFERTPAAHRPGLLAAGAVAGMPSEPPATSIALLSSAVDPVPKSESLYTLHSSLLI